jgi:hypothetical protein
MSVSVRKLEAPGPVVSRHLLVCTLAHTVLAFSVCLVEDNAVDMEICDVTHIEDHDMVVARADVVVRWLAVTVHVRVICCLDLLDHLEDVAHLGWIEIGAREHACVLLAVLQRNVTRQPLDTER